ncbi:DUF547 domain-containing protein [Phormidesmis sp. 146-35]
MINFAPWDALLRRYVDDRGRVDYQSWQREQPAALTSWLSEIASLNQVDGTIDDQLALWINLYNAFTISKILRRYPIDSIRPNILGIPNWIAFLRFFMQRSYSVAGTHYSLAQIENQRLRTLEDPRIHFAIVCASIGCPLLRNEAYYPEKVQQQLEEDAQQFINNSEKVRYDSEADTLYCSKIFKWYRADFLKASDSIQDYIRIYLKNDLINPKTSIKYLYYDWSLNQRTSS